MWWTNSPCTSGIEHVATLAEDDPLTPWTRVRISALSEGPHGVNAAEDDESGSDDGIPDKWLSSWNTETDQKMEIEAKRKVMERFKSMKVYRVVTRESMKETKRRRWSASSG